MFITIIAGFSLVLGMTFGWYTAYVYMKRQEVVSRKTIIGEMSTNSLVKELEKREVSKTIPYR